MLGRRIIPRDRFTVCDDDHTTDHTVCMIDKETKNAGQPTRAGYGRCLLGPADPGPGNRYGEAACWRLS